MMRMILVAALLATTAPAFAHRHPDPAPPTQSKPVPKEDLLKPPADAAEYVVASESGQHGSQWRWQLPDGRVAYRWSQELRGWITEMDQVTTFAKDGSISALTVRGVTMSGDAAEEYRVTGGRATWKTATDAGEASAGGWYIPAGGSPSSAASCPPPCRCGWTTRSAISRTSASSRSFPRAMRAR
jgi:hypothetical protein